MPPHIWLHGASHGDHAALRPLGERARGAGYALTLSAVTAAGRARAEALWPHAHHRPAPLLWGAARALRDHPLGAPRALLLELLELWPPWSAAWARAGVPQAVVNGRVSPGTLRARALLRPSFARLDLFLAQTPLDADRALHMGAHPDRVRVCGNPKHDDAGAPPPPPAEALRGYAERLGGLDVVLGALRPEDERALLACAHLLRGRRALIAPRYPARAPALAAALRRRGLPCLLRSALDAPPGAQPPLLVLDTLGELAGAYALAPAAVVGGGWGARPQGLLEPARAGAALAFGPAAAARLGAEAAAAGGRCAPTLAHALAHALHAPPLTPAAHAARAARLRALEGAAARAWGAVEGLL
ncbi:MAG: hypothetical protein FJ138_11550 [Deltaproteobacteria bacterium]|nr:hypothetical protein [Deltaproteobacteria bacterium]